jgi:uncharacterized coiled-coil DUF342 family protein
MSEQETTNGMVDSLQNEIVLLRGKCEQQQNEIATLRGECEEYQKTIMDIQQNWDEFQNLVSLWEKEKAALQYHINRKNDFEPYHGWSGGFEAWPITT